MAVDKETTDQRPLRTAFVALGINLLIAVAAAAVLRSVFHTSRQGDFDIGILILASIAHFAYFPRKRWPLKLIVSLLSVVLNALGLFLVATMLFGQSL